MFRLSWYLIKRGNFTQCQNHYDNLGWSIFRTRKKDKELNAKIIKAINYSDRALSYQTTDNPSTLDHLHNSKDPQSVKEKSFRPWKAFFFPIKLWWIGLKKWKTVYIHHLCSNLQLHAAVWIILLVLQGTWGFWTLTLHSWPKLVTQICQVSGPFPQWTHAS